MSQKLGFFSLWFFLSTIGLFAQTQVDKSNYQLLWEITGNGLSKPSYVFGSMHLQDPRVFEFSDSMFIKLAECEAFATEIQIDSLIEGLDKYYLNLTFDEWAVHKKTKKRTRKSWGFLDLKPQTGDKPTFLDAYLAGIAKRSGKLMCGLEKLDDYFRGTIEDGGEDYEYTDRESPEIKKFIETYQTGNLSEIANMTMERNPWYDSMMVKRNVIMVASMKDIMEKHTLFAVVGAAHLVGETGLVRLFEKEGFKMRAVSPIFTGLAEKFQPQYTQLNWYDIHNPEGGYKISMPGKPLRRFEATGASTICMYPDFTNGIHYYFYTVDFAVAPADSGKVFELVEDSLVKHLRGKVVSRKNLTFKDLDGVELLIQHENIELSFIRARWFYRHGRVYALHTSSLKERIDSPEIDRFFNSLEIMNPPKNLDYLQDALGAFVVKTYTKPQYLSTQLVNPARPNDRPWATHQWLSVNHTRQDLHYLYYHDIPSGYRTFNDSTYLEEFINYFKEYAAVDSVLLPKRYDLKGYGGHEVSFIQDDFLKIRARYFLRGNRLYTLIQQTTAPEFDNQFMDSFQFVPFQAMQFKKQILKDSICSVLLPTSFVIPKEDKNSLWSFNVFNNYYDQLGSIDKFFNFEGTDTSTGSVFNLKISHYGKYAEFANTDSLFNQWIARHKSDADSILSVQDIKYQGMQGKEVLYHRYNVNTISKSRYFLRDHALYQLTASYAQELKTDPQLTYFFNSLQFHKPEINPVNLFSPKTELLFSDLTSKDSTAWEKAKAALSYYAFEKKHLPYIYKAFANQYPDDSTEYESTKAKLLEVLRRVQDTATVKFLYDFYAEHATDRQKTDILILLAQLKTQEAWDSFFQLAKSNPPTKIEDYNLKYNFSDTLALSQKYFKDWLELGKNEIFRRTFLNLSADLVYDSTFNQSLLNENLSVYLNLATQDIARYQQANSGKKSKKTEEYGYEGYDSYSDYYFEDYLSLFRNMPESPEINAVVRQIAKVVVGTEPTKLAAIRFLLDKKQKIESKWLKTILEDNAQYYNCLQMLRDAEQLSLVPAKYLKPARVAKAALQEQIKNYYGYQDSDITPVSERIIEYNGEKVRVFTYKFILNRYDYADEYEGESAHTDSSKTQKVDYYVGISGPFAIKNNKRTFSDALTGFTYEAVEANKIEEEINRLIEEKTKVWEENTEDVKEED
ncbi:MAG: TraB/GumN family protein [Microscillaceae bacterium]|jgi:uncharacterized protein YbaP (TraB family)|nr:TraB/GumN family protein [Microscillaceae bacterium]